MSDLLKYLADEYTYFLEHNDNFPPTYLVLTLEDEKKLYQLPHSQIGDLATTILRHGRHAFTGPFEQQRLFNCTVFFGYRRTQFYSAEGYQKLCERLARETAEPKGPSDE